MTQTFGDGALEQEVLELFSDQAAEILRALPALPFGQQNDLAHRLKGSACGIGAFALAEAADAFERAPESARRETLDRLAVAVAAVLQAIDGRHA